MVIFTKGYQVFTTYNATTGEFIHTNGGSWSLEKDILTKKIEFDTNNSENVGTAIRLKVVISDNEIKKFSKNKTLYRIDSGTPGKLQGSWLMSGRIKEGKTQLRDTNKPRKTMKILSGTRFNG